MASVTHPDLLAVFNDNGVPQSMIIWLRLKGFSHVGPLANAVADRSEVPNLLAPYITGENITGVEYKSPLSDAGTHAVFTASWEDCIKLRNPPAPAVPAPAPVAPAATTDEKPPKTLSSTIWSTQINKYNNVQLGGKDREFPTTMITGAETVLARMYHEHHVSKLYTVVKLGEILQHRVYTATGSVNSMGTKSKDTGLLTVSNGVLETKEDRVWDPEGQWAILDALESIRWAMIFVDLGTEESVIRWTDWFTKLCRQHPKKITALKSLWTHASWRVAMAMRTGSTFETITTTIMIDQPYLQEHFYLIEAPREREPPPTPDRALRRSQEWKTWDGNLTPVKKPKPGKKVREDSVWQDTTKTTSDEECKKFNLGTCNKPNCYYKHACNLCHKGGHNALGCWFNKDNADAKGNKTTGKAGKEAKGKGKGSGKEPKGKGKGTRG